MKSDYGIRDNFANCGGLYSEASERFFHGTLIHLSRTIKAEIHDAAVVVLFED